MKQFGKIIFAILLIVGTVAICFVTITNQKLVTEQEFNEFRNEVRSNFDRCEQKLDSVKVTVDQIEKNIDTLKSGQEVIYNQVKKQQKSFWDFLK